MKKIMIVLAVITVLSAPAVAQAPDPTAPTYTVATTQVSEFLDKPALKAIFVKYLPTIAADPRIEQGRAMTLPDLVQYAPDIVTPDKLAAIDTELKALPPQ